MVSPIRSLLALAALFAAGPAIAQSTSQPSAGYDTAAWNQIVSTYVTDDGGFRYQALAANAEHMAALDQFLAGVAAADPSGWSREEQLAFYINAYNALTVRSVVELWPVESVLSEDGFFDARTHTVAGAQTTLNDLENQRIREAFGEPRIHFAVNCASTGCPWLANFAYTASNLEESLDSQARAYIRRTAQIDRGDNTVRVSQIFEWFAADFEARGGVRAFVASYLEGEDAPFVAAEGTEISHFDYDWSVNARE